MSSALVAYATVEGQAARIATRISAHLRAERISVQEGDVDNLKTEAVSKADAIVLVASVHRGRHSPEALRFVRRHKARLHAVPCAFFSVSLSAGSKRSASREAAEQIVDEFLVAAEWEPEMAVSVAGALPYSKYGLLKRIVLRFISRQEGGPTDTSRDYEFTDWSALALKVEAFARSVRERAVRDDFLEPEGERA